MSVAVQRWMLIVLVCLGFSGAASASLMQADLFSTGDGLLTLDSGTGLQWLDITETHGLTGAQVLSDVGGFISLGFRYAASVELEALYLTAGFVDLSGVELGGNWQPARELARLIGLTQGNIDSPRTYNISEGFHGLDESGTGFLWHGRSLFRQSAAQGGAALVKVTRRHLNENPDGIAHFLVRTTPVPAPTTTALLALGLLGAGFARKRRHA